jgi:hypothetical protein
MDGAVVVSSGDEEGNPYVGWIASLALIALVLAVGSVLWIHYHGY